MFKKAFLAASMLLFAVAAFSAPAYAGPREGSITVSPLVGGYWWEGDEGIEEDSFNIGFGAGYMFSDKLGIEGVLHYIPCRSKGGDDDINGYIYKVDGLYHVPVTNEIVPYVAAGLGGITIDPDMGDTRTRFLVNYGAGIKYFLTEDLALRGDVRHIISFNDTFNNLSYTLGIVYQFGGKKAPAPEVKPEPPAPPKDSDGDGVIDDDDNCPGTPKGVKVDRDGCPLDSDGDGVPDYLDKCPDTPKGVKVDKDGCPLDSDGDGVPDYLDKCPDTPKGVKVDKDGCPPLVKEEQTFEIEIEFDSDKDIVRPQYDEELKKTADIIKQYPENKAVIEGHTDSQGEDAYNLDLSQRRAEAVRRYLIEKFGVNADQLSAKGYGEMKPIADNETVEGRQKNRRVELHLTTIKMQRQ